MQKKKNNNWSKDIYSILLTYQLNLWISITKKFGFDKYSAYFIIYFFTYFYFLTRKNIKYLKD